MRGAKDLRHSFPCPHCGSSATGVLDTRPTQKGTRRRRKCAACEQRFTTYETLEKDPKVELPTEIVFRLAVAALKTGIDQVVEKYAREKYGLPDQ